MRTMKLKGMVAAVMAVLAQPAFAAYPTNSGTDHDVTPSYAQSTIKITFNDWGYTGPNGATYTDFQTPGTTGFDASQVGQRQTVNTVAADLLTPDPAKMVQADDSSGSYRGASMDGQVNFYKWAYTTPGSTFNNMQIDKNGNYFIAQNDMKFGFYDTFNYHDTRTATSTFTPNPDAAIDTAINFQPYAVSDAKGWCGSVMSSNPNGLEKMAGQVTFDFAFDAYTGNGHPAGIGDGINGGTSTQIVPGFVMRSFGNYTITSTTGDAAADALTSYKGSAVINNTNPLTGELDAAFQNKVSFLGAGVVPSGVWVTADSYNADGTKKLNADGTWNLTVASGTEISKICSTNGSVRASDGARCAQNSYGGYGFLLRADGTRLLYEINPTGHSNFVTTDPAAYASIAAVPVPAAAWLLGSGLIGLVGVARRKQAVAV